MMKRTNDSSYKNLYSGHVKTQSRPKLSSSSSSVKLNAPQYLSNKQNQIKHANRIHTQHEYQSLQPRLRRQFKLYSQLQQQDKPSLKKKVQRLEQLLQKKISEEGFMGFFKTSNSSKQMNHIDIFCQMHSLEQQLIKKSLTINELETKVQIAQKQIQKILCVEQQKRQKHLKEVKTFTDVINKLMVASEQSKQYKTKCQQMKQLLDEVKKQRINHLGRIKQLQQQSRSFSNRQQQFQSIRDELQKMNLRYQQQYHKNKQLQQEINELNVTISSKSDEISELQKHAIGAQQHFNKKDQVVKQQLSKNKALQQIIKSNQMILKQKQITIKKQIKIIQQSAQKIQGLQIQRDYQKCQRLKSNQQILKFKDQIDKLSTNFQSNETIKRTKMNELDLLKKQIVKMQQQNSKLKIQNEEMMKQISEVLKQKNSITNQLKQSTLNQKKLSTEKYRFIMKLQDHLNELKQFNTYISKQQKDTDKILNELELIIINIKQKLGEMEIKINNIDIEKQSKIENAVFNIEMREQTIKILLKFIPEYCQKLVEDYLDVTEEIITNPSNCNMTLRNNLIGKLAKQSLNIKEDRKINQENKQRLINYEQMFRKNQRQKQKQRERQRQKQRERQKQKQRERERQRQRQRERQQQIQRKKYKQQQERQMLYQLSRQQQKQKQRQKQRQKQQLNQKLKLNSTQIDFNREKTQRVSLSKTFNRNLQGRIKNSHSKTQKYFID